MNRELESERLRTVYDSFIIGFARKTFHSNNYSLTPFWDSLRLKILVNLSNDRFLVVAHFPGNLTMSFIDY